MKNIETTYKNHKFFTACWHVLLVIPLILLFAKVFTHGYVLEGMIDRREITLPFHYLNMRAFHAGEYPQWCAYLFSGVPIPHIAMDYAWNPINWPLYFFGKEHDIPYYITYLQILKHILTGFAAFLFFRKVLTSKAGIALATCIYTWSSASVWMTITTELTTGLFLPLGFLLLLESKTAAKPRLLAILAVIFAIDISGGVLQWTYFLWLLWLSYAIYLSFKSSQINILGIKIPTPLFSLITASALAFLLSAPKLFPFLGAMLSGEATRGSAHSVLQSSIQAFQTPWIALIRIISPNLLGYLTPTSLLFAYQPHQNYVETMLAGVGFIAITMSGYGVIFGRSYKQCLFPFAMIAAILAITMFWPVSYLWMFLAGKGMIYSRWAVYLPIFFAWAAGLGFDWFFIHKMHTLRGWSVWIAWVSGIILIVALIYPEIQNAASLYPPAQRQAITNYYTANYWRSFFELIGIIAVFMLTLVLGQKKIVSMKILQWVIVFTCLVELVCSAAVETKTYYRFLVPGNTFYSNDGSLRPVTDAFEKRGDFTIGSFKYPVFYNPFPTSDSNIVYRLPQVSGFTNTMPKKYIEFISSLSESEQLFRHIELPKKLYKSFGVAYEKVFGHDEKFELAPSGLSKPERSRLVTKLEIVDSDTEALALMKNMADPSESVILDKKSLLQLTDSEKAIYSTLSKKMPPFKNTVGEVLKTEEGPNTSNIQVHANMPCLLSIWRGYYSGLSGLIDGKPATVLRANNAFIAMFIPSGTHTVTIRYQNPYLRLGFVCAAMASLICIALFFMKSPPLKQ